MEYNKPPLKRQYLTNPMTTVYGHSQLKRSKLDRLYLVADCKLRLFRQ